MIPGIFDGGKGGFPLQVFAGVFVVVSVVAAVRAARSATVIADESGVVYRSLGRTRRWDWVEIDHFEVRYGYVGYRVLRNILWINLTDGRHRQLKELNGSPRKSDIDRIGDRLNELLVIRKP